MTSPPPPASTANSPASRCTTRRDGPSRDRGDGVGQGDRPTAGLDLRGQPPGQHRAEQPDRDQDGEPPAGHPAGQAGKCGGQRPQRPGCRADGDLAPAAPGLDLVTRSISLVCDDNEPYASA